LLIVGSILMSFSMVAAIWVLQTLRVSQLIPFAAGAYILVPLGGRLFFKEAVPRRFWLGVMSIIVGIVLTFWN
jgi:undecaprenyl phosphate-alpha-L-ara4N flippase subunit ArnE